MQKNVLNQLKTRATRISKNTRTLTISPFVATTSLIGAGCVGYFLSKFIHKTKAHISTISTKYLPQIHTLEMRWSILKNDYDLKKMSKEDYDAKKADILKDVKAVRKAYMEELTNPIHEPV